MFKKLFNTHFRFAAISCLILVSALCTAWATTYYNSKVIGTHGKRIRLNPNANFRVRNGGLDGYLAEHGLDSVEITVEMIEVFDEAGELSGMIFTFGPSGCYFDRPSKLRLKNEYAHLPCMLFDENGEAIEYDIRKAGDTVVYYIRHFSSYYYDAYDY
ncbi:MAG: hypothetical protein O7E52_15435 [Candidatus Poribacteria bacterium]|nr:hypothetical protein [Candidatus Poribacteria bacterium]